MFDSWKPILTALALPPVPLLLLILLGWGLSARRRLLGGMMVLLSCIAIWLACCTAVARVIERQVLRPPAPIAEETLAELKSGSGKQAKSHVAPSAAIVVLGGGRIPRAKELGTADLNSWSLQRLRYGIRLARETGLPIAFSGGIGWSQQSQAPADSQLSEAEIAARVAEDEFLKPLRWTETRSRDTRENAQRTVALLRADGVQQIVLVTHAWHMPRALRAFEQAAGGSLKITPAPLGFFVSEQAPELEWLPTLQGFTQVRLALRELLGSLVTR
ncbi:YdcF family protein [Rivibacter subsaxonicus]|uniref:YdcF family protein n=1 Tax=Rivibacter subsaxonicus TaxID=457575 RepID=UPI001F5E7F59|nr:YdcF family protein [Rivibacter subsaxonicus]